MEPKPKLDEHIFLETYYQAANCTSKAIEQATQIRLLIDELAHQVNTNPRALSYVRDLQKNYLAVFPPDDGTITVDEVETNPHYAQLADHPPDPTPPPAPEQAAPTNAPGTSPEGPPSEPSLFAHVIQEDYDPSAEVPQCLPCAP